MTIYTRGGAPIEITACHKGEYGDGFWLAQANLSGPYPDGSGKDSVGKPLHGTDRVAHGWLPLWEFYSDNGGIKEILEACDKAKAVNVKNVGPIMHYYWPAIFKKNGERTERPGPVRRQLEIYAD